MSSRSSKRKKAATEADKLPKQVLLFLKAVVIIVLLLAMATAIGFTFWYSEGLKPALSKATQEHPHDLEFIAGLLSLSCAVQDFLEIADDLEDLAEFRKYAQQELGSCQEGPVAFYKCYITYERAKRDPDTYVNVYHRAKQLYEVFVGLKSILSKTHKIIRALPEHERVHKDVKRGLLSISGYMSGLSVLDLALHLDEIEEELEERVNKLEQPFKILYTHLTDEFPALVYPAIASVLIPGDSGAATFVFVDTFITSDKRVKRTMRKSKSYVHALDNGCVSHGFFPNL
ncbi:MAG: hypothetical protein ABIH21_03915 [Patescibacteria group bacterium]